MVSKYQFPFKSHFSVINNRKIHFIDEGQGPVIWMMHGMPMWSYVYRKLIPPLVAAGYRCFAPDLMGFGLSDNPDKEDEHTLKTHVAMMTELVNQLELKNITIIGQDWGGPISLKYAIENKNNIRSIILLNTFIERFPVNQKERSRQNIITSPLPKIYEFLFKNGAFSSFLVKTHGCIQKVCMVKMANR